MRFIKCGRRLFIGLSDTGMECRIRWPDLLTAGRLEQTMTLEAWVSRGASGGAKRGRVWRESGAERREREITALISPHPTHTTSPSPPQLTIHRQAMSIPSRSDVYCGRKG